MAPPAAAACTPPKAPATTAGERVLRDYQAACIRASLACFESGVRRQAVSLPVGAGKTVVFSSLIAQLPPPSPQATKVLVLAHRIELLQQAVHQLRAANPGLRVALLTSLKRASGDDADVIVASVPALGRDGSKRLEQLDPDDFKCIVIDEAHHVASATYQRILRHFGADTAAARVRVWGCSATLQRHDGLSLQGAFDVISFQRTIVDLWAAGHLCRPRAVQVRTQVDVSGVASARGDFVAASLARVLNTPARTAAVVAAWQRWAGPDRRATLVFAADVSHAVALQTAFVAAGVAARVVDGSTHSDERADTVALFRSGGLPVLVNCNVFTEGTDIPNIDCIVLARPTRSAVLYQQMVGRGLRLHAGKTDCLLIDVVDNVGRNSIVTAPTLLGLAFDFNANGISLSVRPVSGSVSCFLIALSCCLSQCLSVSSLSPSLTQPRVLSFLSLLLMNAMILVYSAVYSRMYTSIPPSPLFPCMVVDLTVKPKTYSLPKKSCI